jgi:hypothetical protein
MFWLTLRKKSGLRLQQLAGDGATVILGDPGRWVMSEIPSEEKATTFELIETYTLPPVLATEHHGITSSTVYKVLPPPASLTAP